MVIVFSLVSALGFGLADFIGGFGSKRAGNPWAVALLAQLVGSLVLLSIALNVAGTPVASDWGWALAGGALNGLGTAALYRGLSAGRMGVVAPVSAVGAATLPVLVGLLTGERPSTLVWLGIAIALPAIWLVAREPEIARIAAGASVTGSSGFGDGILAGIGFGGLFCCLAQIPDSAGFGPVALNQFVAALVIAVLALLLQQPLLPRRAAVPFGITAGALASLSTGAFLLATQTGYLSVAAVITSLYPAATVLLAASLLRERIHGAQAVGLVFCLAAVSLVAAG